MPEGVGLKREKGWMMLRGSFLKGSRAQRVIYHPKNKAEKRVTPFRQGELPV